MGYELKGKFFKILKLKCVLLTLTAYKQEPNCNKDGSFQIFELSSTSSVKMADRNMAVNNIHVEEIIWSGQCLETGTCRLNLGNNKNFAFFNFF